MARVRLHRSGYADVVPELCWMLSLFVEDYREQFTYENDFLIFQYEDDYPIEEQGA